MEKEKRKRVGVIKALWQNNISYTLLWTIIGVLIIWAVLPKGYSRSVKLLLISSPILFTAAVIILIILAAIAIGAAVIQKRTPDDSDSETRGINQLLGGIFKRAPANQVWVTRRTLFGCDIDKPDKTGKPLGYRAYKATWGYFIPGYHEDLGVIDLSPQPKDPPAITVNTKDNQTAIVDWRKITFIPDEISAMKCAAKVNGNRDDFEDQQATVIFNQICSQKTQNDLTEFDSNELAKAAKEAAKLFNRQMKKLDIGIKAKSIEIKKILMPEEVRAAAEYKTVSQKRLEVASIKGNELKTIIEATGADATKIAISDMIRAVLMDLADPIVNAFRTRQETKEKGGENK